MTWIELHPEASRLDRIKAMAFPLIGESSEPSEAKLEFFGLEEDFDITMEPMETCLEFDAIVMRCKECDWYFATSSLIYDRCHDCHKEFYDED